MALPVALAAGPILVTLLTFFLVIPVGALVVGGPLYLLLGWPACLIWFRRHKINQASVAGLAFVVMLIAAIVIGTVAGASEGRRALDAAATLGPLSLLFATLWGWISGWLYTCWCRAEYANSIH